MNIEVSNVTTSTKTNQTKNGANNNQDSSVKFSDELKEVEKTKEKTDDNKEENLKASDKAKDVEGNKKTTSNKEQTKNKKDEKVEVALSDLNKVVNELNQLEEKNGENIKKDEFVADNKDMINNDFSVENKDILPQMNPGMSFNSNGQPFSSFMSEETQKGGNNKLTANAADLAEEAAILSTMAENIAMANKNNVLKQGIKTNSVVEQSAKFDTVIMNEADVEVFTQLVQNGSVDMNNLAPQAVQKAVQVSKTLADMLAKSIETNQPLRIDFDNDISVIIKISRDGKITADFLPSSQVAEAYLKENLPLLKQKFDNENIKYDELNQRERREHHREQNRKKGRNDE